MSCKFLKGPTDKFFTFTAEYQNPSQDKKVKQKIKISYPFKGDTEWG